MRSRSVVALLIATLALVAAVWAIAGQVMATSDKQAAQQQAQGIADPVAALCASNPAIYNTLSADSRARWDRACTKAAEVQQSQTPAPGPTDAQVAGAVDAWLQAHPPAPGQSVTPGMVATAVADWLTTHPPQPGRPPTPEEIAAATSSYLTAHAAMFQGQPGQDGRDATDAQVTAAVTGYCAAHNSCAGSPGKDGSQGPQGVSITDVTFERDSTGTCQVLVTLHNPATGTDTTVTHDAGEAACPALKSGGNR